MHNNYYFLRQLTLALAKRLERFTLVSCFSQNKDELVLEFNNAKKSFFIKASLQPDFQCLSFPSEFTRARKNSVDLFLPLFMKKVKGLRQFRNERSFAILFEDHDELIFKMHGAQANVILAQGGIATAIFRNNFPADMHLKVDDLDHDIDWSKGVFLQHQEQLHTLYYTFGRPVWNYLDARGFSSLEPARRWVLLRDTVSLLENPRYYISNRGNKIAFLLLPDSVDSKELTDPIEALNEFFYRHQSSAGFFKEKSAMSAAVTGRLKQTWTYLEKTRTKLKELEGDEQYQQWADLIMANLHHIRPGQEFADLENFYDQNKTVRVKLKPELSPQKNAEVFYRKAKNRDIEVRMLKESLEKKEQEWSALHTTLTSIDTATDLSGLKGIKMPGARESEKAQQAALPYMEFEFKGFKIWVGRNAKANDELTLKHSFKEDLWLHAKDVPGSHVLLKYQAGKPFPKEVKEHAAELAAYYSKRKNESLCPVAVTPKKFVRKRKGDPAGSVVVEREDVLLVVPRKD